MHRLISPSKKKLIHLKKIGRFGKDLDQLRNQLLSGLGDSVFALETQQKLLFELLIQIYPINRTLKMTSDSIEKSCLRVLSHLHLNNDKTDYATAFLNRIIGIDKLPSEMLSHLSAAVGRDLLDITELIGWYEAEPVIVQYLKKEREWNGHEQNLLITFYKRCLAERIKILNYQLYGLRKRALTKSGYRGGLSSMLGFYEDAYDRPYYFGRPFSQPFFDCRKIDQISHRIENYYIDEIPKATELYHSNKARFYREYFKRTSPQEHFQEFSYYLSYLPNLEKRKPIFNELVKLFKAKRWLSFYALALPQVEGLFYEMGLVIDHKQVSKHKSLTAKVGFVRAFHGFTNLFDYFQYHIPFERNTFVHTGFDEGNFKLKSYDLLVDLSRLLRLFYSLGNPLVTINKLLVRRNFEDFISINDFANYFIELNALKHDQKEGIQAKLDQFERDFLCAEGCNLEYTCLEMISDFPQRVEILTESIQAHFAARHSPIDFLNLNKSKIGSLLGDHEHIETMRDCFTLNSDTVERLTYYHTFIMNFKKYLPSLDRSIVAEIDRVFKLQAATLKNIIEIKEIVEKLD